MKNITFTDIAAFIGCVTGLASLIMSFRQIWTERFALILHFHENENLYFDKLNCCKECHTKLQGLIRVRFENRSATPITVFEVSLSIDGVPVSHREFKEEKVIILHTYLFPEGKHEHIEIPMERQILLPLRIDPFDAYEGYMFIPFYPTTEKTAQSVKLQAKTTKGTRTKYSTIWICKTLVDDGNGPFFQ